MDYNELAAVLVRAAEVYGQDWAASLMKNAAEMIRKQGDELKQLKANTYVRCPRCQQKVSEIRETGQCGFCDLMISDPEPESNDFKW